MLNVLELNAIDVQNGQVQRSYVRNVDLLFDNGPGLAAILSNAATRIRVTKFDLNGANGVVQPTPGVSQTGNTLKLDFGLNGVGGATANRETNAGDGYYEIAVDADNNGSYESVKRFFRLLGGR